MAMVKAGLIQMSLKGEVEKDTPEQISEKMIQAHLPLIDDAARQGVQVLGLQEISVSEVVDGLSRSEQLDVIVAKLGDSWDYYLPWVNEVPPDANNMFNAILWNSNTVNLLNAFAMEVPDLELAGEPLFKRKPLVGYFEALNNDVGTNDFLIVNVHLASGQTNDENHIIAMVLLEHGLSAALGANEVQESDRIILGDFNDNPYATNPSGSRRFSNGLYAHMAFKRYTDLVTDGFHSTRMDNNLRSVIDHILVNNSAQSHIPDDEANIFLPGGGDSAAFGAWRGTFSDHFPLTFRIEIENEDDDVDFDDPGP